jgi:hypothetical protein
MQGEKKNFIPIHPRGQNGCKAKKDNAFSIHPRGQNGCKAKKDNAFFHSSFPFGNVFVVPKEKKKPTSIHIIT